MGVYCQFLTLFLCQSRAILSLFYSYSITCQKDSLLPCFDNSKSLGSLLILQSLTLNNTTSVQISALLLSQVTLWGSVFLASGAPSVLSLPLVLMVANV